MSGRARPDEPLADWCEAKLEGCRGRAQVRHHLAGRRKSPRLPEPDAADNTIDICLPCHRWIHANPARSYELGLMRKRVC